MNIHRALSLCGMLLMFAACGDNVPSALGPQYSNKQVDRPGLPEYTFAVHPLHNPQKLDLLIPPMMAYVSKRVPGVTIQLEASNDYAAFEAKLKARSVAFALPNPYHAVIARPWGYHVIAKMGNDADFRGIFLVRKDSGIKEPKDLIGRVVSYPAPTALAAAMMPQLYLHNHGVNVNKDIQNSYVGTHESSIMNVFLKQSAAGATWPPPWRVFQRTHPKEAAELFVAWETETMVQNAVLARDDIPSHIVEGVRNALAHMHEDEEGRAILAAIETPSMDLAQDKDYDRVEKFLAEFRAKVRTQ
jgi:phosphonate transport system substrate-binding protein